MPVITLMKWPGWCPNLYLVSCSNSDREGHTGRERHSRKRCATDNDKELQETLPSPLACSRFVSKFVSAPPFSPPQVIQPAVRSVISFPFPGFNNPSLISVVHCLITPFDTYKMIVHQLASEVIIPLFQINCKYRLLVFTPNFITSAITSVELLWGWASVVFPNAGGLIKYL